MLKVFSDVAKNVRLKPKDISIDNLGFKLHYRFTFGILMVCCVLVCSRQYIGEHIRCITHNVPGHVIDTYCFVLGTFTVPTFENKTTNAVSDLYAHPGVGPAGPHASEEDYIMAHLYYQWIPFLLFGQALLFYLPHFIWKNHEGSRLFALCDGFQKAVFVLKFDSTRSAEKVESLRKHFQALKRFKVNRDWGRVLVMCEWLNLFNVILQFYLTNWYLGGNFLTLGLRLYDGNYDEIFDKMFPKVAKCTFHQYGPSGTLQSFDSLCVLALNIINEKIYLFLWFWFALMLVVSVISIFWRLLTCCLLSRSTDFNQLLLWETSPGSRLDRHDVAVITKESSFYDWLFLYYIGKNLKGALFRELLHELAADFEKERADPVYVQPLKTE